MSRRGGKKKKSLQHYAVKYYPGSPSSPFCPPAFSSFLLIINVTGTPSVGQLPCGATRVARHWAEVCPSLEKKTKGSESTKKNLIWNTKKQRMDLIKMQIECKLHEFNSTKKKKKTYSSVSLSRTPCSRTAERELPANS